MTSQYVVSEIERELSDRLIDERLSFTDEIRFRLLNAWEALQFLQSDLAKQEYALIIGAYEKLEPDRKEALYSDIHRLFLEISYVQETEETTETEALTHASQQGVGHT
jgi:hypothetical protein